MDWAIYTIIATGCHKVEEPHMDGGEQISLNAVSFERLIELVVAGQMVPSYTNLSILQALARPEGLAPIKELFRFS